MKKIILITLYAFLALIACACRVESEPNLEERMKIKIDMSDYEYLERYSLSGKYQRGIWLTEMHFGSYTGPGKNEIFAVFKLYETDHAAGYDSKIAAVYDGGYIGNNCAKEFSRRQGFTALTTVYGWCRK